MAHLLPELHHVFRRRNMDKSHHFARLQKTRKRRFPKGYPRINPNPIPQGRPDLTHTPRSHLHLEPPVEQDKTLENSVAKHYGYRISEYPQKKMNKKLLTITSRN